MKRKVTQTPWDPMFIERSPAFEIYKRCWNKRCSDFPNLRTLNSSLEKFGGRTEFKFIPQDKNNAAENYIRQIEKTGEIRTRENCWHDFFNALTWIRFPLLKKTMNKRHSDAISKRLKENGQKSTTEEHICSLLNENGIGLACACKETAELILNFRWKELFWTHRERSINSLGIFIFGHALLEKLLTPYIGLTGHGILIEVEPDFFLLSKEEQTLEMDKKLCRRISKDGGIRKTTDLAPYPLLGHPKMSPQAENEAFYMNQDYFRPGRRQKNKRNS